MFAAEPIAAGRLIDRTHILVIEPDEVPAVNSTVLLNYCFVCPGDALAVPLGLCGLFNHSYEPNARFHMHFQDEILEMIALRDISEGEEILFNYNGDPTDRSPLWFPTGPDSGTPWTDAEMQRRRWKKAVKKQLSRVKQRLRRPVRRPS